MPSEHYMVVGHMLLGSATDDIPRTDEIRTILKVRSVHNYYTYFPLE